MGARMANGNDSHEQPHAARRALLTGGAVGLAALAGSALGRPQLASAATTPTPDWVNVKASGATGNGTTDDTGSINTALGLVPSGGVLYFPVGTYKTTGTITLPFDVRMVGDGAGSQIVYYGSGDAVRQFNPSRPPYSNTEFAGGVEGMVIDGTNSTGAACGLHIGDGSDYYLNRLRISNFLGSGAIGLHLDNTVGWTEKMTATVQSFNNSTAVVFDVNGSPNQSFMYNDFDFHISVSERSGQGQQGITLLNGALIQNARLKVRGNFFYSDSNSFSGVSCLDLSHNDGNGNYCYIADSFIDIAVEVDNWTGSPQTGWQTIKFGTNASNHMTDNLGLLVFSDNGWTDSDASQSLGQFSFSGVIHNEANLVTANAYNPPSGTIIPGQLLCPTTNYTTQASPSVNSATLKPFDTNNITTGSFSAPRSGNVLVSASFMGSPSAAGQYVAFGLLGHSGAALHGTVQEAYFPTTSTSAPLSLEFLVTGLTPGQNYQFDLAGAVASGTFAIVANGQSSKTPTIGASGAGGPVVLAVAAA